VDAEGVVYIGSGNGVLYALESRTGKPLWKVKVGNSIISSPAIGWNGVIYFGAGNKVYAVG